MLVFQRMSFSRSSSSYSEMIARLSVYRFSRLMYVTPGRGLPELRWTVGAVSDRYIGEVILQLLVEAMASHWIVPSHCPNWELNIFLSYHCHQQHIKYVSFQVLFIISDYWFIHRIPVSFGGASPCNALRWIMMLCRYTHSRLIQCNHIYILLSYHCHQQHIMYVSFQVLFIISDYWFIHRIPVSFGGASPYNALRWIMMLCCYTHSRLIQCNHSYMIPKYDALYDLKRQWYYEFVPFLSNQSGIDILLLWGDVACTKRSGWKNMHSIVVPGFNIM